MKIIKCEICTKKVAEVRDASLIKGLVCFCSKCNMQRIKEREEYARLKTFMNRKYDSINGLDEFFKHLRM